MLSKISELTTRTNTRDFRYSATIYRSGTSKPDGAKNIDARYGKQNMKYNIREAGYTHLASRTPPFASRTPYHINEILDEFTKMG